MTSPTSDFAAIRERHRPTANRGMCLGCLDPWPCDTARVLEALEEARKGLREIQQATHEVFTAKAALAALKATS